MIRAVVFLIVLMLKIIGILLLFGLLLLAFVLFVPVRYSIKGQNSRIAESLALPEEVKNTGLNVNIQVNVSWFLHFIRYTLDYGTNGISGTIRVLGIDIQKLAAKWRNIGKHKSRKSQERGNTDDHEFQKESEKANDTEFSGEKQHLEGIPENISNPVVDMDKVREEKTGLEVRNQKKKSHKKKNHKKKRRHKEKRVRKKESRRKKEHRKKNRIHSFYKEFTDPVNRNAISHLWKELLFLLSSFKPRKIKADLAFSLADPALTGYLLGFFSMFPFLYKNPCHIIPDFNSEDIYVEGEIFVKGKITVIAFLLSLFRLWRDKEFIHVFKRVTGRG